MNAVIKRFACKPDQVTRVGRPSPDQPHRHPWACRLYHRGMSSSRHAYVPLLVEETHTYTSILMQVERSLRVLDGAVAVFDGKK